MMRTFILLLFLLHALSPVYAEVRMPAIISDHMVLQRDRPLPIWGEADPGERVTVIIAGQTHDISADDEGRWCITLDPLSATTAQDKTLTMRIVGQNTIELTDILVGEVWLCSGQSNMEFKLEKAQHATSEVEQASDVHLRLFQVARQQSFQPVFSVEGTWQLCQPQTARQFSAVGYFFGSELRKELDVPVGVIQSAWGGTPAEAWTTRDVMLSNKETRPIVERWDEATATFDQQIADWEQTVADWDAAQAANPNPESKKPKKPAFGRPNHPHRPSGLFHGMIEPLIPFGIRGVAWYQGETNRNRAYQYRWQLPLLIKDWRTHWGQGDFPFLIVQLPGFGPEQAEAVEPSTWSELREGQLLTLRQVPNTGLIVTIDVGEADDIHPRDKKTVGHRLALSALHDVYRLNVVPSGPLVEDVQIKGSEAVVRFDHVGSGLATRDDEPLRGFAVAPVDGAFVWAEAMIQGDEVILHAPGNFKIDAVRYAWADNPNRANLINREGLPASPFRTDNRTGLTDQIR